MDDIRAVMDAAGMDRAAVLGWSEGGTLSALFAASHPERCQSLVLQGAFARFQSWLPDQAALDSFFSYVNAKWGSGESYASYCPAMAGDEVYREWWGRRERSSASPSSAIKLMQLNSAIDASAIMPTVNVPTLVVHRTGDQIVDFQGGRELARLIPNAELAEIPGSDHVPWTGDGLEAIASKIQEFLTGAKPAPALNRVLATILFTDIASSTEKAEALGDKNWKDLLNRHNALARQQFSKFRGKEIKATGDGFLAMFDAPARAVHAALSLIDDAKAIGLRIRAGVHIGEVQIEADDITGIAVNVAARTMDQASGGNCLITRTVKDLVAGSELNFELQGTHHLKGLSEEVILYTASA